jgi:hypothetical protein
MTTRQTIVFVKCLFGLIGLDWEVANLSTLIRRRQRTLKVNIPYLAHKARYTC